MCYLYRGTGNDIQSGFSYSCLYCPWSDTVVNNAVCSFCWLRAPFGHFCLSMVSFLPQSYTSPVWCARLTPLCWYVSCRKTFEHRLLPWVLSILVFVKYFIPTVPGRIFIGIHTTTHPNMPLDTKTHSDLGFHAVTHFVIVFHAVTHFVIVFHAVTRFSWGSILRPVRSGESMTHSTTYLMNLLCRFSEESVYISSTLRLPISIASTTEFSTWFFFEIWF